MTTPTHTASTSAAPATTPENAPNGPADNDQPPPCEEKVVKQAARAAGAALAAGILREAAARGLGWLLDWLGD